MKRILLYLSLLAAATVFAACRKTEPPRVLGQHQSPVRIDDNSIADWTDVIDPEFRLHGSDGVTYAKFDYDADYVYFLFALNTTLPGCDANGAILNLRLDTDDLTSTGMPTKSLGCDWYLEGNFWKEEDPWTDWYDCSSGDTVSSDSAHIKMGTFTDDGDIVFFEFALSRKEFGINGTSLGLFAKFYDEDWDDAIFMMGADDKSTTHFSLDKTE